MAMRNRYGILDYFQSRAHRPDAVLLPGFVIPLLFALSFVAGIIMALIEVAL